MESYIETRADYSILEGMYDDLNAKNAYIGVYIQMDDTYKYTTRKVASLSTAFS